MQIQSSANKPASLHTHAGTSSVHQQQLQAGLEELKRRRRIGAIRQWAVSTMICVSMLIMGTTLGWASPALYNMRSTGAPVNLTEKEIVTMVSSFYVGSIVMAVPGGLIGDKLGRRISLLVMTVAPLASWVLVYTATRPMMLHIARIFAGSWSGHILTVVPLYLGEIVEQRFKKYMNPLMTLSTYVGVTAAYVIGSLCSHSTTALIFGAVPVVYFLMLLWVPHSPYWLLLQGEDVKVQKSLMWLRGYEKEEDAELELFQLTEEVYSDILLPRSLKSLCQSKSRRVALTIIEVIFVSQPLVGMTALMAYAATTLPDKTLWVFSPNSCAIVISLSWLMGGVISIFLIDVVRRRRLLMLSCGGVAVSAASAGLWYFFNQDPDNYVAPYAPLMAFFVHGVFFNLGLGPIPLIFQGEMISSQYKTKISALTTIASSLASVVVNSAFPYIIEYPGTYVNFAFFCLVSVVCLLFSYFYVVETKDKTSQDIACLLEGRSTRGFGFRRRPLETHSQ